MSEEKKIKILGFNLDWLIKMLIQLLAQIIDQLVPGAELTRNQKKAVRLTSYLGQDWGKDAVEDTETDLDDEALATAMAQCEDAAAEGGFKLPIFAPF